MKLIGTLFIIILSASLSYAGINTLSPFSSTTWTANSAVQITISDDGKAPLMNTLHNITCDLYAGNSQNQVFVANIAKAVDCATTQSIPYTVSPTVGPEASCYFIRYTDGSNSSNIFYSGLFTIKGTAATQAPASSPASNPNPSPNSPSKSNSSPTASGTLKAPTAASSSSGDFNHPISNFAGLSLAIIAIAFTLL
ncbi:23586_t:CDS:2 [Cetraspora pellucida]|uniref:23586_t:CDS:1 n=1 Tax=Cetraspora pellucida TaxID=1433469 RepID=A0A9N9AR65_9GLOM|nr:23586_t:CDS:2 [Cetraspora pellucida]